MVNSTSATTPPTHPPTHLLGDVLARRPEGTCAAQVERLEGICGTDVMRPLLPRRQGLWGDHLQRVLLAQKVFFAEHLMDGDHRRVKSSLGSKSKGFAGIGRPWFVSFDAWPN